MRNNPSNFTEQQTTDLLLDVWREACRHIEMAESLQRIAPRLAQSLPVEFVLVRLIDLHARCVETIAVGKCGNKSAPPLTRDACSPDELEALLGWAREGKLGHGPPAELRRKLPGLLPAGLESDVVAGPLTTDDGPIGALLAVATAHRRFGPSHLSAIQSLLEPLCVAMENDRRLHEISRLREAAEADRRSLLSRLGRQDISDTIVGVDTGLRPVMHRIEQVAPTDVPVLIFGETGSGKEVIARSIHARSRRPTGPFLRVNCGAIPSELIDSELFGHERGSFTGAVNTRQGWFERADGGTLFLDEVGELPLAAQVRLLRILQDGCFERVGGSRQLKVDVRIVAATNRDLQAMVADGRFRNDLWYRLAVFPVHLPPLRDRVQDIPALATHFALRASTRFGTPPLVPTPEDINLLAAYSWPGNARELATVMERAAILGDGRHLEVAKALGVDASASRATAKTLLGFATPGSTALAQNEQLMSLDSVMARHIEAVLARTAGRVEGPHGAAKLLGINPHTLRARMRKLGVDWRRYRMPDTAM